jgi:hypothetical protein
LLELEVEGFKGRLVRWWSGSGTYQGERGGNTALQRRPQLAAVSGLAGGGDGCVGEVVRKKKNQGRIRRTTWKKEKVGPGQKTFLCVQLLLWVHRERCTGPCCNHWCFVKQGMAQTDECESSCGLPQFVFLLGSFSLAVGEIVL